VPPGKVWQTCPGDAGRCRRWHLRFAGRGLGSLSARNNGEPGAYGNVSYGYVSVIALVLDPGRCEAPSTGNTATGERGPHDNDSYNY
jgi:hypothetical protein